MNKIGDNTIQKVAAQVQGLMEHHRNALNLAMIKSDKDLSVSFTSTIKPNGSGFEISTAISFTVEKLKDSSTGKSIEGPGLFDEDPHDRRCRLHTTWMIDGGLLANGSFIKFYNSNAAK